MRMRTIMPQKNPRPAPIIRRMLQKYPACTRAAFPEAATAALQFGQPNASGERVSTLATTKVTKSARCRRRAGTAQYSIMNAMTMMLARTTGVTATIKRMRAS